MHATIPKGIVGGFQFTVLRLARKAMDICLPGLKESSKIKFDSYSARNSVLIISHITFRDCRVHIFPTTFLEIAVYLVLFSDLEGDSCFRIYQISWIRMKKVTFCKLKTSLRRNFVYNLQTFRGFCQVHFYDLVANSACMTAFFSLQFRLSKMSRNETPSWLRAQNSE